MLYYCKDIELFRKFQVNGEVFCEVTPSQGLWRSNNHLTTEETEVNGNAELVTIFTPQPFEKPLVYRLCREEYVMRMTRIMQINPMYFPWTPIALP